MNIFFLFLLTVASFAQTQKNDFENYLFTPNEHGKREGKRTDAALVIQNGKTIFEKYARLHDESKKHITWSVSKTVMSLLYGVALKDNLFRLDQTVCDFATFRPDQCAIQIRHVLEWSTAIEWLEEYENTGDPKKSSVLAMLYGEGRHDQADL